MSNKYKEMKIVNTIVFIVNCAVFAGLMLNSLGFFSVLVTSAAMSNISNEVIFGLGSVIYGFLSAFTVGLEMFLAAIGAILSAANLKVENKRVRIVSAVFLAVDATLFFAVPMIAVAVNVI